MWGPSRPVRQQIVEPGGSTIDIVATRVQPRVGVTEGRATRLSRNPVVFFATVDRFAGQVSGPECADGGCGVLVERLPAEVFCLGVGQ
jgi:hypothetical protein